jgi:peptidoglycan/xylan/chitin deacetylase (PgdA/CDA1 family)
LLSPRVRQQAPGLATFHGPPTLALRATRAWLVRLDLCYCIAMWCRALTSSLLLAITTSCQRELPVLLYHEVGCGTRDSRDVPTEEFEAQLGYLETHGYRIVPLASILGDASALPPKPAKPVAISFDDGAACLYDAAYPVLRRRSVPFELFLVSDWVAQDAEHRVLQEVGDGEKVPSLIWPEVHAMVDSRLATVGGHGRTHQRLTAADPVQLANEVTVGRQQLAAALGNPVDLFAYPYGAFDVAALQAARRAGYAGAFCVASGTGGRFAYRRRSIHRGLSEADFASRLGDRWILPLLNHN